MMECIVLSTGFYASNLVVIFVNVIITKKILNTVLHVHVQYIFKCISGEITEITVIILKGRSLQRQLKG